MVARRAVMQFGYTRSYSRSFRFRVCDVPEYRRHTKLDGIKALSPENSFNRECF